MYEDDGYEDESLEDRNYRRDRRVRARGRKWYERLDERKMTAVVVEEDEEGEEVEREVRFTWEVCSTCDGKGTHVNPSIDAGGLTREDFADDPDFFDDYRRGVYDVECYECRGRRVSAERVDD